MDNKLDQLIEEYFNLHNKKVPDGIKKYLRLYLEKGMDVKITPNDLLNITKKNKLDVNINDFTDNEQKLIYAFCKMKEIHRERPKLSIESNIPLKRLSLGLEVSKNYGNSIQEKEILQIIDNNSQIYLKFKQMTEGNTMAHLHFLNIARNEIREFENKVLDLDENDIFHFYIKIKPYLKKFMLLNEINGHFLDTRNPFSFLKFYHKDFLKNDDSLLYRIFSNCTTQLNENLNEWLKKGKFNDYGREFFIFKNEQSFWHSFNIELEMIPFFISQDTAQEILYIGKASNLIEQILIHFENLKKPSDHLLSILHEIHNLPIINVLNKNFDIIIHNRLQLLDFYIKEFFIKDCQISNHLIFCKETFFFARSDFIEHLFFHMKDISKSNLGRRSFSFILETAIQSSFGKNHDLSSYLDMCVIKNDDFSLFYRLDFPINVIIEKDVIMIFLSIFKYLWKIKKIEHFIRRLKERKNLDKKNLITLNKWFLFLQKIFFYFTYEVIEKEFVKLFSILHKKTFVIDKMRSGIKKLLKNVILEIFQENNSGKESMDTFLDTLEQECINFRKHKSIFDDGRIKYHCRQLFESISFSLENTSLCNISDMYTQ